MKVYILNPGNEPKEADPIFSQLGEDYVIDFDKDQLDKKLLTFVNVNLKHKEHLSLKALHLEAWHKLLISGDEGAHVFHINTKIKNLNLIKNLPSHQPYPGRADLYAYTSPRLRIQGDRDQNSDWALLNSSDPLFNSAITSYYITTRGALKLYGIRNEFLNNEKSFGTSMQIFSSGRADPRVFIYAFLHPLITII